MVKKKNIINNFFKIELKKNIFKKTAFEHFFYINNYTKLT